MITEMLLIEKVVVKISALPELVSVLFCRATMFSTNPPWVNIADKMIPFLILPVIIGFYTIALPILSNKINELLASFKNPKVTTQVLFSTKFRAISVLAIGIIVLVALFYVDLFLINATLLSILILALFVIMISLAVFYFQDFFYAQRVTIRVYNKQVKELVKLIDLYRKDRKHAFPTLNKNIRGLLKVIVSFLSSKIWIQDLKQHCEEKSNVFWFEDEFYYWKLLRNFIDPLVEFSKKSTLKLDSMETQENSIPSSIENDIVYAVNEIGYSHIKNITEPSLFNIVNMFHIKVLDALINQEKKVKEIDFLIPDTLINHGIKNDFFSYYYDYAKFCFDLLDKELTENEPEPPDDYVLAVRKLLYNLFLSTKIVLKYEKFQAFKNMLELYRIDSTIYKRKSDELCSIRINFALSIGLYCMILRNPEYIDMCYYRTYHFNQHSFFPVLTSLNFMFKESFFKIQFNEDEVDHEKMQNYEQELFFIVFARALSSLSSKKSDLKLKILQNEKILGMPKEEFQSSKILSYILQILEKFDIFAHDSFVLSCIDKEPYRANEIIKTVKEAFKIIMDEVLPPSNSEQK